MLSGFSMNRAASSFSCKRDVVNRRGLGAITIRELGRDIKPLISKFINFPPTMKKSRPWLLNVGLRLQVTQYTENLDCERAYQTARNDPQPMMMLELPICKPAQRRMKREYEEDARNGNTRSAEALAGGLYQRLADGRLTTSRK